ncbi:DUF4012 domain-containing protein [Patescibacteria group bacterium]|nr:DUF4012 domain-containing protein [Patescibacteria group bacterium]MBU1931250.1 DUF4012 domain-containing protein [Patescibacteria group bacterium]
MKKIKKTSLEIKTDFSSPNVLVAGGAGFVGSHLCQVLFEQGCKIFCIDNWTTGRKENIESLLDAPNFTFLEHDINKSFAQSLPKFDYIFHLAGMEAYLNNSQLNLESLLVNAKGTERLLKLAAKQKSKFLLASSHQVYSGIVSKTSLEDYFGASATAMGTFSHHEAKRFAEALVTLFVKNQAVDARIVRLNHIYGPHMDINAGNEISRLFKNYKENKNLVLVGEGLQNFYPTYVADVVNGMMQAMFLQGTQGRIFTLVNSEATTLLNLAYVLRKISKKNLEIEFIAGEAIPTTALDKDAFQTQKTLGWQPMISLEEGIKKTLGWLDGETVQAVQSIKAAATTIKPAQPAPAGVSLDGVPTRQKPTGTKPKKSFFQHFNQLKCCFRRPKLKFKWSSRAVSVLIISLLLIILLSAPFLFLAFYSYRGVRELNKIQTALSQGDLVALINQSQKAEVSLDQAKKVLQNFSWLTQPLGLAAGSRRLEIILDIGGELAFIGRQAGQTAEAASNLVSHSLVAEPANYEDLISSMNGALELIEQHLGLIQSSLWAYPNLSKVELFNLGEKIILLSNSLPKAKTAVVQAISIGKVTDRLIALDGKKTYLVVFQNNAELRPTGGFIGSFGLLTFEKGRLLDFIVEDVYAADGQLKGHVEPPAALKKYLGQASWYLRDANWSPDFPTTAKQIEWFLKKEIGREVDGVIGINLNAVQLLLEAIGPIELVDYGEKITAQNLFEKAEYHAEIDFFPGSTQKKDFLGSLAVQLFEALNNSTNEEWLKLAQAIKLAFGQKEILLSLHDSGAQKVFDSLGWSGAIRQASPIANSLKQHLLIVEANVGINKANYFLDRSIDGTVIFQKDNSLSQQLVLTYKNRSPSQSWPAGDYKTYLRFYLPSGFQFEDASLISLDDSQKELDQPTVDEISELDRKVLGFYLEIPVGESRQFSLKLKSDDKLVWQQKLSNYSLYLQKQSGTQADPIHLTIEYPSFFRPIKIVPQAKMSEGKIEFQAEFETDKIFSVDFAR